MASTAAAERFAAGYLVDTSTGCWVWQGSLDTYGYGRLRVDGRLTQAHRFALVLAGVDYLPGLEVAHHCGRRSCVNPDHLVQVTRSSNRTRSRSG
jgi:hypothetical protein